ncbi:MAG: hypothetical protein QOE20_5496 [Mycobacterium sp.]|jgi:hypothetical protein|nr:hypothetical protein [Mycobacterium sp.]
MTDPSNVPVAVTRGRSSNRRPCKREGCPRPGRSDDYCCRICRDLDTEFDRLHELYDSAGDPSLSREAWLALSSVSDQWTEFVKARFALHQHIREAGLPLPQLSRGGPT